MSPRSQSPRTRRAAMASLVVLLALVVHNIVVALRNRGALPPDELPHVSPRDIEQFAYEDPKPTVRYRIAHLYHLQQRVADRELSLPPSFAELAWDFERVARMRVTVSATPQLIRPRKLKELRRRIPLERNWHAGKFNGKNRYQILRIELTRNAESYVLAETTTGRELYLIPRERYEGLALPLDQIPDDLVAQPQRLDAP